MAGSSELCPLQRGVCSGSPASPPSIHLRPWELDLLQFNWTQPGSGRFSVCGVEYQFVARIRALTLGFSFPTCKMGLMKPAFLEDGRILREVVRVPCQLPGSDLSLVTAVMSSGPLGTTLTPSSPRAQRGHLSGCALVLLGPGPPPFSALTATSPSSPAARQGWHL